MKKILVLLSILICQFLFVNSFAQSVYTAESTEITFFSEAPMENIEAVNKSATSMLTIYNDTVVFLVPIKGFKFKKALMEEHFNENYLESDKKINEYARLRGKINEKVDYKTDGEYKVTCTGSFEIHGVTLPRSFEGTITIKDGKPSIYSQFKVKVADHKIKIPNAVIQNIAEEVLVTVRANYKLYVKP